MITISEIVEELIKDSPFIEEGLERNLINLSELARSLQPTIEKKLYKKVGLGAIVMALKRQNEKKISLSSTKLAAVLAQLGDISVRSHLREYTYINSPTLSDSLNDFLRQTKGSFQSFVTVTQGVYETTLFVNDSLDEEIHKIFHKERLKHTLEGLCAITLIIPQQALDIPGVYYSILKALAWEGVNFIEISSSFTELTLFVKEAEVDKAFSILKGLGKAKSIHHKRSV